MPRGSEVVDGMWGGGGEFLKLAGCPGEAGEARVVSSGGLGLGLGKLLAESVFSSWTCFFVSACYLPHAGPGRGWEAAPGSSPVTMGLFYPLIGPSPRRGLSGQVFVSAQWPSLS